MNSAKLKERIDIYKQIVEPTDFGDNRLSYEFKYSCRACVNYSSGNRIVENDEIFYSVDREFIVRHYVPIVDTDIIEWDNKKWRVLSIDRDKYKYNDIVIKTTLVNE